LTQVILLELLTAEISFKKKTRLWAIFLLGKCSYNYHKCMVFYEELSRNMQHH